MGFNAYDTDEEARRRKAAAKVYVRPDGEETFVKPAVCSWCGCTVACLPYPDCGHPKAT